MRQQEGQSRDMAHADPHQQSQVTSIEPWCSYAGKRQRVRQLVFPTCENVMQDIVTYWKWQLNLSLLTFLTKDTANNM